MWGPSRYETNLATSLLLRGRGVFPYASANSASESASNLSESDAWWGPGLCPRAVIIVAADLVADALSASVLSDPTGQSREPYLRRSAAADPLFDPVGGYSRVDTDFAPLVVTESARSGATHLSTSARVTLQDMRFGGCREARAAIIVGGLSALPAGIEDELLSIGYQEIFRVGGANRYETAAAVLTSLGTAPNPTDSSVCEIQQNMLKPYETAYYANSVVEWHQSATECEILGRTVVLADGVAGVDALTAGWWTSYWQTPVLLHNGTDALPEATRTALQTASVENIIILGGKARISDEIANTAKQITGASVRRVAGSDRFETSVAMAKHLGGWWPNPSGRVAAGSVVCMVGSAGVTANSSGWADAMAAGPWCGASSRMVLAPQRALPPITGSQPSVSSSGAASRYQSIPVLLVRAGVDALPPVVADYLEKIFPPDEIWCSSLPRSGGCATPGFAVVFGGPSVISDSLLNTISGRVGGNPGYKPYKPSAAGFVTGLQMSPNYFDEPLGGLKACWSRGSYTGARWLQWGTGRTTRASVNHDAYLNNWYRADAQGTATASQRGAPGCLAVSIDLQDEQEMWLRSVGPYGRGTNPRTYRVAPEHRLTISKPLQASGFNVGGFQSSGISLLVDPPGGGISTLTYASGDVEATTRILGQWATIQSWYMTVTLKRGQDGGAADTYSASIRLDTSHGVLSAEAEGGAIFLGGNWFLRGQAQTNAIAHEIGHTIGGFALDIFPGAAGVSDDRVSWSIDGYTAIK